LEFNKKLGISTSLLSSDHQLLWRKRTFSIWETGGNVETEISLLS